MSEAEVLDLERPSRGGSKRRGDTAKAVAYYRKSLELDPRNENAVAMLAKLGAKR